MEENNIDDTTEETVIPEDNSHQNDADRLIREAKEEAQTNLAGWQRTAADFENYKKREEAKQKDIMEFAKEVTVVKMLPTLDTLEQGLKHLPDQSSSDFAAKFTQWKSGIEGTLQKLDKVLEEMGVKKIEAVGKQFDPNFHEAVRMVPGGQDNIVIEELQTGFEINGKVIRPSQVAISKKE